jgi:hypothetical protein
MIMIRLLYVVSDQGSVVMQVLSSASLLGLNEGIKNGVIYISSGVV